MKLLSFRAAGQERVGVLDNRGDVIDLNAGFAVLVSRQGASNPVARANSALPSDLGELLGLGSAGQSATRDVLAFVDDLDIEDPDRRAISHRLDALRLAPPLSRPPKIICVARNYREHAEEVGREVPTIPILFARFPSTLIAHGAPVVRPRVSEQLDWEGELAVVIGTPGRYVSREVAMSHVAGYSIFNDVTVRDYQFRVTQYTAGKNFSHSGPFGPYLVTADEVPDLGQLEIVTKVNGEQMQRARVADMIFDVPTLIEHISEFIDLEAGDVIATGTPAGVGFSRTPPQFLRAGDVVSVSIAGLGQLDNPVIEEIDAR